MTLPPIITDWFAGRGWAPRRHQLEMVEAAAEERHALLIAATGAGKTLAGFLPTLAELIPPPTGEDFLHTLYISPLKALAVDVRRNLLMPVEEMGLPIRIETRTGDTPPERKARQRVRPPHILLTTPESLSLLLSHEDSVLMFAGLKRVIIDEVHAFANSKRGDLLSLSLARLQKLSPQMQRVGLSATISDPDSYRAWLAPYGEIDAVRLVAGEPAADPDLQILLPEGRVPWSGHSGQYAVPQLIEEIGRNRTTLIFCNTRFLAEYIFQKLWDANDPKYPIGIHHGSLSVEARRKVEGAMAAGQLRALVCTASLDLGVDWGDVDCVIQMGAPKGSSRLLQRIGRSNHRMDVPSKALLVPGNRFEYLEAQAAFDAVEAGVRDGEVFRPGGYDVLAQHVMACACAAPFSEAELLDEVRSAMPYSGLDAATFGRVIEFVATGGYALKAYDKFRKLVSSSPLPLAGGDRGGPESAPGALRSTPPQTPPAGGRDLMWRLSHPKFAAQHRFNAGIIVDAPMLDVRFKNGRSLGRVEEGFAAQLRPGDAFIFAGMAVEVESIRDLDLVVRAAKKASQIPSYMGARMPLTTHLASRVRAFLNDRAGWARFPDDVREWLEMQDWRSALPEPGQLLAETFPHEGRHYLVVYPFEGWNAHQSLAMLITKRMEMRGLKPMGFVANDYALGVWGLGEVTDPASLFSSDILEEEFVDWVENSYLLKRAFREVAIISGLVERQHPGKRKSGKQVTFSTDLIYDVLRKYEPGHLLLEAAWHDARARLTDVGRLGDLLDRAQESMLHVTLDRVSPMAVPLMVMIGRESVAQGSVDDALLVEAESLAGIAMTP
ncbi:ligase-associated DNA damage response DEXH box helicase [Sphingorhabdus sp.]|uniref:ligase-associated DNA damage response DEXH box helicase n=1 Tax=Sphingorhabdus sp. TaxID=1902408 RepID=UPI0035B154F8